MSKIEEVKKATDIICADCRDYEDCHEPDCRKTQEAKAEEICELFEPKPDEEGLLADEGIYEAAQMEWNASHLRVAKAQLAKDEAECRARIEEIFPDGYYPTHLRNWADQLEREYGYQRANIVVFLRDLAKGWEAFKDKTLGGK